MQKSQLVLVMTRITIKSILEEASRAIASYSVLSCTSFPNEAAQIIKVTNALITIINCKRVFFLNTPSITFLWPAILCTVIFHGFQVKHLLKTKQIFIIHTLGLVHT